MKQKRITSSDRKRITADWQRLFPDLEVYKPMHLLNRVGPLLVGILLEVKSGAEDYIPTFHVHNLSKPSSSLVLSLKTTIGREYVRLDWHENKYRDLARRLGELAVIPLGGDLTLDDVLMGYRRHLSTSEFAYRPNEYEDMVLISSWCGNSQRVDTCLSFAETAISTWPEAVLVRIGGVENWVQRVRAETNDSQVVRAIVEEQMQQLNAVKLPYRDLKC